MSTTVVCNSFKDELAQGIHNLNTDVIKVALFPTAAALTKAVTAYGTGAAAAANEITGTGYPAGGGAAASPTLTSAATNTDIAAWDWADVVFSNVTISGVRYALMYNSSKANRAIQFVDYGAGNEKSATAANFTVTIPESGTGALRFA